MSKQILKHPKLNYSIECDTTSLYKTMLQHTSYTSKNNLDDSFLKNRIKIINILFTMNKAFKFKSQTVYAAIYYLDYITMNNNLDNTNNNNCFINHSKSKRYALIALSCFILSCKFLENDPYIPNTNKFCDMFTLKTDYSFVFNMNEVKQCELYCITMLHYNLFRYTLYDYLSFYFGCGIIAVNKQINNVDYYLKAIEEIYIRSREMIDDIIINKISLLLTYKHCFIIKEILHVIIQDLLGKRNNCSECFISSKFEGTFTQGQQAQLNKSIWLMYNNIFHKDESPSKSNSKGKISKINIYRASCASKRRNNTHNNIFTTNSNSNTQSKINTVYNSYNNTSRNVDTSKQLPQQQSSSQYKIVNVIKLTRNRNLKINTHKRVESLQNIQLIYKKPFINQSKEKCVSNYNCFFNSKQNRNDKTNFPTASNTTAASSSGTTVSYTKSKNKNPLQLYKDNIHTFSHDKEIKQNKNLFSHDNLFTAISSNTEINSPINTDTKKVSPVNNKSKYLLVKNRRVFSFSKNN